MGTKERARTTSVAGVPPVVHLGVPDEFVAHGCEDDLFESLGLQPAQIAATIKNSLNQNTPNQNMQQ